ncbi:type II secretion system minor pseudopilin GspI, partial [Erwinia amylovora]|uniref:type II secretion system minor pseudopilin GspI n=1 Tax=Erwinia amylovora TaxID=552 RepID=UPI00200B79E8
VNLASENIRNGQTIEERTFANVVAENRAVEALTSVEPPAFGETAGAETAANRLWRWTRTVSATADPEILRVDIAVTPQAGRQVLDA